MLEFPRILNKKQALKEPSIYHQALFNPALRLPIKVAGVGAQKSVIQAVRGNFVVNPSNFGCLAIKFQPNALFDRNNGMSELFVTNDATFSRGNSGPYTFATLDLNKEYGINAGTYQTQRVIGSTIRIFVNHPTTYPEPLIEGAIIASVPGQPRVPGDFQAAAPIPADIDKSNLKFTSFLPSKQTYEMVWLPNDKSDGELVPMNQSSLDRNLNAESSVINLLISRVRPDCQISISIYTNYEAIPVTSGNMAGTTTDGYAYDNINFISHIDDAKTRYAIFMGRILVNDSMRANVFQDRFLYPRLPPVKLKAWNLLVKSNQPKYFDYEEEEEQEKKGKKGKRGKTFDASVLKNENDEYKKDVKKIGKEIKQVSNKLDQSLMSKSFSKAKLGK